MIKTIGNARFGPLFGDREAVHATIRRMAGEANSADLLVFPEPGAPTDAEHPGIKNVDLEGADDKMITQENHLLKDRRVEQHKGLKEFDPQR